MFAMLKYRTYNHDIIIVVCTVLLSVGEELRGGGGGRGGGGQPPSLDRSYFHVLQSMHSSVIVYTLVCCAW